MIIRVNNKDFKQGFLEAEPYWDNSKVPLHLYKAKEPYIGKIVSVKKLGGEKAAGDVYEVVVDHQGKMPYWEGQSYGVVPPGKLYFRCNIDRMINLNFPKALTQRTTNHI